jgi:endoglucanase
MAMLKSLKVVGSKLYAGDEPFVLKGASTHGLAWYPQYVNKDTFAWLKAYFKINAIRLAMYTAEEGGYCVSDKKAQQNLLALIDKGVKAAVANDLYVIIDWHILSDNNPLINIALAKQFFGYVSRKYYKLNNVIYEICNEPNGETNVQDISNYANEVIPCIRINASRSLIIVGTPTWSQRVDLFADAPLPYSNLLYSLHFYSSTHDKDLMDKAHLALDKGLPLIVSEFGVSPASGNGPINLLKSKEWFSFLKQNHLSYFFWALGNRNETCCIIKPSCNKLVDFNDNDLTEAGLLLKEFYRK